MSLCGLGSGAAFPGADHTPQQDPESSFQTARRTAAPRPISTVPTITIVASSRIAGIERWTATGGAAVTDDWSVAADDDPEAVVAIANPASVSVTSCLRITVGSSPVSRSRD